MVLWNKHASITPTFREGLDVFPSRSLKSLSTTSLMIELMLNRIPVLLLLVFLGIGEPALEAGIVIDIDNTSAQTSIQLERSVAQTFQVSRSGTLASIEVSVTNSNNIGSNSTFQIVELDAGNPTGDVLGQLAISSSSWANSAAFDTSNSANNPLTFIDLSSLNITVSAGDQLGWRLINDGLITAASFPSSLDNGAAYQDSNNTGSWSKFAMESDLLFRLSIDQGAGGGSSSTPEPTAAIAVGMMMLLSSFGRRKRQLNR